MRAAAALILAFSLASVGQAQPESVVVAGVVSASSNGEALARVRVDGPGDARTFPDALTDERGRFTLRVPSTAPIRLRLSKAGFATATTTLSLREAAAMLRLQMDRGSAISGRLISTSGVPLRGWVFVHPETPGAIEPVKALTDDRGEFRVGGLPPGRYVVTAGGNQTWTVQVTPDGERNWVPYGPTNAISVPPAPPKGPQRIVTTRAGEDAPGVEFTVEPPRLQFGGADVPLGPNERPLPPGSISGTVRDERGEPIQGVVVRAQHLRTVNGRTIALTATDSVESDDRGQYRVFGLRPGEYVVSTFIAARLDGSKQHTVTYAADGLDLESAARVQVGDSESGGVDVVMAPVDLFNVEGHVISSTGAPAAGSIRVSLTHRSGRPIPEPRTVPIDPDGGFRLAGLPPGDYAVQANTGGSFGAPVEFGVAFVTVGEGPQVPLAVRTAPLATLSGRIIVDGTTDEPQPTDITLRVLPADPDRSLVNQAGTASLATQSDGTFYITRLAGRNRIVLGTAAEGWFMKELLVGSADVAAEPFDFGAAGGSFDDALLVLSPRGAVLTGQAEQDRNGPPPPYWAVVFPTDTRTQISRSQFIKHTRASADGTFRFTGLPPGSYFVAAVRDLTPPAGIDEWQPADLARLAGQATRITLAEGETLTVRPRLAAR